MTLAGYQQWIEIFDENISKIWRSEGTELQKAAMLFGALKQEFRNVREKLEDDLIQLREKIEEKESLTRKSEMSLCLNDKKKKTSYSKNKENQSPNASSFTNHDMSEVESPDLFRNVNNFPAPNDICIDLSMSDEEKKENETFLPNIKISPTIRSKFKNIHRPKKYSNKQKFDQKENIKKNIFEKDLDNDMSVIDCTPESNRTKTDIAKTKLNFSDKHSKGSTSLTKMFSKGMKRKVKQTTNKVLDSINSDETYYEENSDEEPMLLTDLLNYINKDEQMSEDCVEENFDQNNISNKKHKKIANVEIEPVVKGLARKQLTGFSCEKCRKFYGQMNLSPEELQKVIDECSKHRYKYNLPEDTLPGFWDLSFDPPP